MTGWVIRKFSGTVPRVEPGSLPDNFAASALDAVTTAVSLRPLRTNTPVAATLAGGTVQTIYRFGKDAPSDAAHWFSWADDVDVVIGPIAGDVQERTYFSGAALTAPMVTDSSVAVGVGAMPAAAYLLGVPTPVTPPTCVKSGTPQAGALAETRVYVVVTVDAWGQMSGPSPASAPIDVILGESVTLTLPAIASGNYVAPTGKYIYRSVQGSGSASYLYVGSVGAAATSFVDNVLSDDLGEVLPSMYYSPPPAGLKGLVAMPGGVIAGFVGRDVYFSEPYRSYAFPIIYSHTLNSPVVALGVFGTTLLALTTDKPYLISGSDPSNYVAVEADVSQACIAKRSVADADGGVIFASPDGLFMASAGGFRNLTEGLFTRVEWQTINPSTLHGYVVGNKYIGFHSGTAGFMLDLATGDFMPISFYASAGYYDGQLDDLFLVVNGQLVKFDTGVNRTMTWRSKPFYSARAVNLGSARVEAAAYPVTANIYADGVLVHTQSVLSANEFRLPSGFVANKWSIEVVSANEVLSMGFAETVQELRNG